MESDCEIAGCCWFDDEPFSRILSEDMLLELWWTNPILIVVPAT